jgi:DNA-binding NtrC family response regulator
MLADHLLMNKPSIVLYKADKNLRLSIALILERAGYHIVKTDNISKVLELIKSRSYPLVISDLDMPETRSILLPKIQDFDEPISAVIFTDQAVSKLDQDDEFSNIHYLEKPVAPERLLDFIREVIYKQGD